MKLLIRLLVSHLFLFPLGVAFADNLKGAEKFLCAPTQTSVCTPDGICESGPPIEIGVPQFVEVDLKRNLMETTKASDENRVTEIRHVSRNNGYIYLQGLQLERAFSIVIRESTGMATMAIAIEDVSVTIFGSCTPLKN